MIHVNLWVVFVVFIGVGLLCITAAYPPWRRK